MFEGEVYAPELEDTVRSSHSLRRSVECRVSSEERKKGRKEDTHLHPPADFGEGS
jgi:hypothetical protein